MPTKSKAPKLSEAKQVNEWLKKFDSTMRPAIDAVRNIIKAAGPRLNERIKWNAPSFYYNDDIVTFGPARNKDKIILVFHHPTIVKIKSAVLQGDYKNRRLVYLNSMEEIRNSKEELERIVKESIAFLYK